MNVKQNIQDKIISSSLKEYENYITIGFVYGCDEENDFYSISYIDNYGRRSNKDYVRNFSKANYTPNIGDIVKISISDKNPYIIGKYIQNEATERKSKERYMQNDIYPNSSGCFAGMVGI